jgi:hypothetical protein
MYVLYVTYAHITNPVISKYYHKLPILYDYESYNDKQL